MRSLPFAALNRFVGNEPGIPTTTQIGATRMPPARNVALVLIRNAESKSINFNSPRFREVKDVFVAIVQKPLRIDWLEMTMRPPFLFRLRDGNRFDPVNCVLQNKQVVQLDCDFVRQHRIGWRGADIEKKRAPYFQDALKLGRPFSAPLQI